MKYFMLLLMISACATKQSFKDLGAWNEKPDESVQLSLRSIKKKGKKSDLVIVVVNRYPHSIVIPEGAIHYSVNNDMGLMNRPSPRMILNPGQGMSASVTYNFVDKEEGPGDLKLEPIYAGNDIIVSGVNSHSRSVGSSFGNAYVSGNRYGASATGSATSFGSTSGNSEGYQKKSAVEGKQLPSVALQVP